jgi:hypothetical protein
VAPLATPAYGLAAAPQYRTISHTAACQAESRLPPAQRELLWLTAQEHFDATDVGWIIGIDPARVAHLLRRAWIALADQLNIARVAAEPIAPRCQSLLDQFAIAVSREAMTPTIQAHAAACAACCATIEALLAAAAQYRAELPCGACTAESMAARADCRRRLTVASHLPAIASAGR